MTTTTKAKKLLKTAKTTVSSLVPQLDKLPARMKDARKAAIRLESRGERLVKKHPVAAVAGALAVGIAATRIARHI